MVARVALRSPDTAAPCAAWRPRSRQGSRTSAVEYRDAACRIAKCGRPVGPVAVDFAAWHRTMPL